VKKGRRAGKEEERGSADLAVYRKRDGYFGEGSFHRVSDEKSDGSVLPLSDDVRVRDRSGFEL